MCSRGHGRVVVRRLAGGWSVVMNDAIDMGGGCHFLGGRKEGKADGKSDKRSGGGRGRCPKSLLTLPLDWKMIHAIM